MKNNFRPAAANDPAASFVRMFARLKQELSGIYGMHRLHRMHQRETGICWGA
jgi:hypothetical protein